MSKNVNKYPFLLFLFLSSITMTGQGVLWLTEIQSIRSYSSPRSIDLNGDNIEDVVFGAGVDGYPTPYGVMALDGLTGNVLWNVPTKNEMFGSPLFLDVNSDGVSDVIINGRDAELRLINGVNGNVMWEFWDDPNVSPNDSGWYNFYNPQIIHDQNNDNLPDLLCSNGGDHSLDPIETDRPPGHILIIDNNSGNILKSAVVPDSNETYMSPLYVDLEQDGDYEIIFGTGGESIAGNLWIASLSDLINEDLSSAIPLLNNPNLGVIAPPSLTDLNNDNVLDIVVQGFDGKVTAIDGVSLTTIWEFYITGTESSASPVIGLFTASDNNPDVFATLYKGSASTYTDFYQVLLDGESGSLLYLDSLGDFNFTTPVAFDSNFDGKDEVLISLTNNNTLFEHQLLLIDFINDLTYSLITDNGGDVWSTPLIKDIDNNDTLDFIYITQKDNPFIAAGINISRYNSSFLHPTQGVSWGSYMGTEYNSIFEPFLTDCKTNLDLYLIPSVSCPGDNTGSIDLIVSNGMDPYTFSWSNGSVSEDIDSIGAGSYTVIVADATGCQDTATISVTEYITTSLMQPASCNGVNDGWAYFNSTGCNCNSSNCQYTWSVGGVTIAQGDGSSVSETYNYLYNLGAGTYTSTIIHPDGCVVQTDITVTEPNPLIINVTFSNASCYGYSNGYAEVNVSGGEEPYEYYWDYNNVSDSIIMYLPEGSYTCFITDGTGCIDSVSVVINQPDELEANIITTDVLCNGDASGTAMLSISGGTPPYIEDWQGINPNSILSGSYMVTLTDANSCLMGGLGSIHYTIIEPSLITVSEVVSDVSCYGFNDGSLQLNIIGGVVPYVYVFAPFNGIATPSGNSAFDLSAGQLFYQIDDANGCVVLGGVVINEPSQLSANVMTSDVICNGDSSGSAFVLITGGTSPYTTYWNGVMNSSLPAGAYIVNVSDDNDCEVQASYLINEPPPISTSSILGNQEVEYNSLEEYSIIETSGSTYDWILSGGGVIIIDSLLSAIDVQWENTAGLYTLSVVEINEDGCVGDTIYLVISLESGVVLNETTNTLSKTLDKVVDITGKEVSIETKNVLLFCIYNDGTVEKKINFKD